MGRTKEIYVHSADEIPQGEHWAILESVSVNIPGDERSRQAPGHGYPEHTEQYLSYVAFTVEEEFKAELTRRLGSAYRTRSIRGIHVLGSYAAKLNVELAIAKAEADR